jgi:hypothetical protein
VYKLSLTIDVFGVFNSFGHLAVLFMVPALAASHISIFLEYMYALVMYVFLRVCKLCSDILWYHLVDLPVFPKENRTYVMFHI